MGPCTNEGITEYSTATKVGKQEGCVRREERRECGRGGGESGRSKEGKGGGGKRGREGKEEREHGVIVIKVTIYLVPIVLFAQDIASHIH